MAQIDTKSISTSKNTWVLALGFIVVAVAAYFLGIKINHNKEVKTTTQVINSIAPVRENNLDYTYTYPLLSYDFGQANNYLKNVDLTNKLNSYVQNAYAAKNADSVSVYVRNFFDNHWAGVNEDAQYHPGSLLKVLIMMAYYREAELDPSVLQKTYLYSQTTSQEINSLQYALPTKLVIGQTYTVSQLLQAMIGDSDNGAETLLIDNVDRTTLNNAYQDLNIPNPDTTQGDYTISARQYAAFLRVLYNATYLSEAYSEQALSIMAKSTYKDGLAAGLPGNVPVAQKYGERVEGSDGNIQSVELHNCGIVYAPNHPYVICIMTKGKDINKLTGIIKDISSLVYNNLSAK